MAQTQVDIRMFHDTASFHFNGKADRRSHKKRLQAHGPKGAFHPAFGNPAIMAPLGVRPVALRHHLSMVLPVRASLFFYLNMNNIWRKIEIRGGHTLNDLHQIIFEAFDRDDEHLYSFYIPPTTLKSKNKRSMLKTTVEYTHPFNAEESFGNETINAEENPIESLNLLKGHRFLYLFDFGDEWWHEITVEQIESMRVEDSCPMIIEKNGNSPPQYEWDDEDE